MSTCGKIKGTKTHVCLELSAKRAVRTYINKHAWKTHILLDLFAKHTACIRAKTHVGFLLDLSAEYTTVKLMYINSTFHVLLELTASKDKAYVWKLCAYQMSYL